MLIKAAIFDMDGLMLDTERLGLDVFRRVIAELGFDPLDEVYLSTVGRNWFDTRQIFLKALGERFPFDEMRERWLKYNDDHVTKFGVPHKTGLLRLVQRIQVLRLPRAVATSTMREKALALLKRVNLLHHFDTVVGGDEVTLGKPIHTTGETIRSRAGKRSTARRPPSSFTRIGFDAKLRVSGNLARRLRSAVPFRSRDAATILNGVTWAASVLQRIRSTSPHVLGVPVRPRNSGV